MMNKLFKRNQLIITALAALVAVAGYLSFGDTKKEAINTYDLSDADVLAQIDAGVTMIDNKVDVRVLSTPLEITEITRIEEAIKSTLGVEAKDITITVVDTTE
jgi:amino acid permease